MKKKIKNHTKYNKMNDNTQMYIKLNRKFKIAQNNSGPLQRIFVNLGVLEGLQAVSLYYWVLIVLL